MVHGIVIIMGEINVVTQLVVYVVIQALEFACNDLDRLVVLTKISADFSLFFLTKEKRKKKKS